MFVKQIILIASCAFFTVVIASSESDLLYGEITIEGPSLRLQKNGDGEVTLAGLVWGKLTSQANDASYTFERSSLITRKPIKTSNYAAKGNNKYESGNCTVTELAVEDKQYSVAEQDCPNNVVQVFVLYASDVTDTQPITKAIQSIDGFSGVEVDYDNAKLKGSMVCTTQ